MNDAERRRAVYHFQKADHLPRLEFGIWNSARTRWKNEGWNGDETLFKNDESDGLTTHPLDLGWVDVPVFPRFKEELLKIEGNYKFERFYTGEIRMSPVDVPPERVMPVFVQAPVESKDDWYKIIKPRLDPETPERWIDFEPKMAQVKAECDSGERLLDARCIGGYMYLRSLCGPEKLLYLFYDAPELLHDMMKTWLNLMVTCLTKVQDIQPFFKFFMAEDIAYKQRPLLSPKMAEEFLMPYYRDLIQTLRAGQKEYMHVEVDSDGNPDLLLPLYIKNGFTVFSPLEVAAGCDPIFIGDKYPELALYGGVDKRVLAQGKEQIKRELDRIIPYMIKRRGFIPKCDHSVPDDVSFENFMFYREYITSIDSF